MLIAGNWKMFKDATETAAFCHELAAALGTVEDVDVAVCPPYTSLVQALALPRRDEHLRLRAERPLGGGGRLHRRDLARDAA